MTSAPTTVPDGALGRGASLRALFRLLLRMQLTPLRVTAIGALGLLSLGLAALARTGDDPLEAAVEVTASYGLGLVLPLAVLWFATSSVGDLVDDRLLVYVWLKPVPRWQLPGAAVLATVTIVVPLVAVPLVASVLVAGEEQLIGAVVLATALAAAAYGGLFVALGLWLRRALWWGLLYLLVWENGIARAADGAARLSVASYAQSIVADAGDVNLALGGRSTTASVVVPLLVAVVGWALAVWRYRAADVD